MPTYSYACTVCDHAFDVRQSFTDESLKDCPVCFDSSLRKVIHPVGISFKGSGFYKTDSRASKSSKSPAATGDSGSSKASGDSGSSTSSGDSGGSSAPAPSGASSTGAASASSTAS